jgi:hypothetical protein
MDASILYRKPCLLKMWEGAFAGDGGWGPWSLRKRCRCCWHCRRCWGRGPGLGAHGLEELKAMTLPHHNWWRVGNIEIYQISIENQFLTEACAISSSKMYKIRKINFWHCCSANTRKLKIAKCIKLSSKMYI